MRKRFEKGFTLINVVMILAVLGIISSVITYETQASCSPNSSSKEVAPKSASGVKKAEVIVKTDQEGLTVEQKNIRERILEDNKPGSIKHLYIISPYSGQVLLYSTVKGKVTSSGKRITPLTVAAMDGEFVGRDHEGFPLEIGGRSVRTGEVMQDDGSYGDSVPYIFWWDSQGRYHQHFFTGGQIIHISDQPIVVKSIILNLER